MTIRLALIIPTMDQGGAEKQLCLLAENLPSDAFDVHVFLLTRDGPLSQRLRQSGIEVTVIGKRFKAGPSALFQLRSALRAFKPDIVHTWLFAANSFGRVAAKLAGVPRILASERCVDLWKTPAHFFLDRHLAKFTEAITVNSDGIQAFYESHGIDRQKFRVIQNGITPVATDASHAADPADIKDRLQVPRDRRLILSVGRLWPQKRYRDLVWAAELLATMRGDTTLVIVGDGPQSVELLRHRDAVSSELHVRFAGHRSDVAQLLGGADVFWIGSEFEGQSNGVIEAMQAGLPVVASDIPGNRDLVVHEQTGFLVKLGDSAAIAKATHRLLESPSLCQQMGQAGKRRIDEAFTVDKMVNAYIELYQTDS